MGTSDRRLTQEVGRYAKWQGDDTKRNGVTSSTRKCSL